eukprot:9278575-Pyramimonas_sp.AAC.1
MGASWASFGEPHRALAGGFGGALRTESATRQFEFPRSGPSWVSGGRHGPSWVFRGPSWGPRGGFAG